MTNFYSLKIDECLRLMKSSALGLTDKEAKKRIKKYGPNKLPEKKSAGFFSIFLNQFKSPLIYVLAAACLVIFLIGEFTDGFVILFVLFFNAAVGAVQEGKAQNTLAALKKSLSEQLGSAAKSAKII